jgi:hypothetical protein
MVTDWGVEDCVVVVSATKVAVRSFGCAPLEAGTAAASNSIAILFSPSNSDDQINRLFTTSNEASARNRAQAVLISRVMRNPLLLW